MTNGTIVTLKKNTTHDVVPSAEALYQAELAINTADANIFTKRDDGVVLTQSIGTVVSNYGETSSLDSDQVLDSTDATVYRSAKYVIQTTHPVIGFQTIEILIMHDGSTAYITRYGLMYTSSELATFSADIVEGQLQLLVTPLEENVSFKWTKTLVQA